jgi:hypothetical protein
MVFKIIELPIRNNIEKSFKEELRFKAIFQKQRVEDPLEHRLPPSYILVIDNYQL